MGLRYWVLVKGGATVGLARRTSGLWNFGLAGTFLSMEPNDWDTRLACALR